MEIDITQLMARRAEMKYYSASVAEYGENAAMDTWQNACDMFDDENADRIPDLIGREQLGELRSYFGEFGAWDSEELEGMTLQELNALLLQLIAGDIRERSSAEKEGELKKYEENQGGRIYPSGKKWFYYVGN